MVQAIAGGSVLTWASPEKRLIAGGSVLTWASPEKILIAGGSVLTWASPEKRLLLVFMRKRGCDYKMKGNLHMLARDVGNRRTTHTGQARDQVMYGLEVSSNKQAKNNVSACCQLDAYLFRSIKKRSHGMEGHPSSIIRSHGVAPFVMLAGHPSSIYWVP